MKEPEDNPYLGGEGVEGVEKQVETEGRRFKEVAELEASFEHFQSLLRQTQKNSDRFF